MAYDVLIIGAGLSGIAAGVRLAHFGQRVCIAERHRLLAAQLLFPPQRGA